MSSVWIVLLDVSGSMDEGFSSAGTPDPLAERGSWRTKLEAAKDLLMRHVEATRVQDVAVITFAERTEKIFHGARADFSRAVATIQRLKTDGSTNLAAGLSSVIQDPDFEPYQALSVLILSDGLSNVGDPVAAAEELIGKFPFARIDTILIDETEEGRRVAESVSINGSVRPAFSVLELGQALESARASSLRQELAGFAQRRLDLQSEIALMTNGAVPTLLTVTSAIDLTAATLRYDVVPTIEGLESLGRAASEATGLPYRGAINSISHDSPLSISLSGLKEAVELALEWVIPWRRENAARLAKLKLRQQELENQTLEMRLAHERVDVERGNIENRRLEVQLADSKLALAERMLAQLDPDHRMSNRRRQQALREFVNGIDHLSETRIEFKAISGSSPDDKPMTTH